MFKKLLASVGIGSAKVDTYVLTENLVPGCSVDLKVFVEGSKSVEQDINGLTLALCTSAKVERSVGDQEVTTNETVIISKVALSPQDFGMMDSVLKPGEKFEHSLSLILPDETPVTSIAKSRSKVWIATGLDIDFGLDSSDKDFLQIQADSFQEKVLSIVDSLGYSVFKVDVEKGTLTGDGFRSSIGCYQEFEFKGGGGLFSTREIELSFVKMGQQVGVLLEKDRFLGSDSYYSAIFDFNASVDEIKHVLSSWL